MTLILYEDDANNGHPATENLRVTERLRRRILATWVLKSRDPAVLYRPDSELLEYMGIENNKDLEHLVGK